MATMDSRILFSPYTIKGVTFNNRFVMPAMQRGLGEAGIPTPKMTEYFTRRIEGGVSLVMGESTAVNHPSTTSQEAATIIYGDAPPAWKHCIDSVKTAGGEMFVQLWHEGAVRKEPNPESPSLSPSGLVQTGKPNGRAATIEELDEIKAAFVEGAVTAQAIGATGIEIHCAHGYFLDLFLWPETNLRTDQYGGPSIVDRVRYPADIVAAVRAAVGEDFIISFRFSQWKEVDFDAKVVDTPEQLKMMVAVLEDAGVDIFHVSTRRILEPEWPEQSDMGLAGWTKSFTDKTVIAVGSVGLDTDLMSNLFGEQAEPTGQAGLDAVNQRCAAGEFDLVSVGRALIGDADWVNKARDQRWSEMKPFTVADLDIGIEWEMDFVLNAHADKVGEQ